MQAPTSIKQPNTNYVRGHLNDISVETKTAAEWGLDHSRKVPCQCFAIFFQANALFVNRDQNDQNTRETQHLTGFELRVVSTAPEMVHLTRRHIISSEFSLVSCQMRGANYA